MCDNAINPRLHKNMTFLQHLLGCVHQSMLLISLFCEKVNLVISSLEEQTAKAVAEKQAFENPQIFRQSGLRFYKCINKPLCKRANSKCRQNHKNNQSPR